MSVSEKLPNSKGWYRGRALPFSYLLILGALALHLALQRAEWVPDDSDIALRYAQNLWGGEGFCFTPGDSVCGSTSVLNPLLIAGTGFLLAGDLVLGRALLFGLSLFGLVLLVHRAFRPLGTVPALLAATNVLAIPLLFRTLGLETILVLLLATASVQLYLARRPRLLGLGLGALYLARPDGLVLALLLLGHSLWTRRREEGYKKSLAWTLGLALILVLPWLLYAWTHFGTPIPGTLRAKLAQRASGAWGGSFFSGLKKSLAAFDLHELLPPKAFRWVAIPSLLFGLGSRSPLRLLVLWALLLSLAYSLLNPPFYHWYGVPLHFAMVLGFSALVAWLWKGSVPSRSLALALNLSFLALAFPNPLGPRPPATYPEYHEAARWIRQNLPPEARILALEIGVLGARVGGRPILDPLGLVHPADYEALSRGDFAWWLGVEPLPDFVLLHRPPWKRLETSALADPRFTEHFSGVWRSSSLQLFKKKK
ncbi:MAG TPA: hypothetical protein ENK02_08825 [Planctomycetes bacterium]|nr:hypothetical protein [Planctomycetota bacterium]